MTNDRLIVRSLHPFNAEPPAALLRAEFLTPQQHFYVRCHGTTPAQDVDTYRLRVGGMVAETLSLGLGELKRRFSVGRVVATLQCAGNRRADMQRVRPTSGEPWGPGAIGTAEWTGVALRDVLRAAGTDANPALHVAFEAADQLHIDGRSFAYGVSIAMLKAMAEEVLLAWAINGEPLSPEHGAPLRAVVPGYAGVRSAKWLQTITVQDRPSDNPMQAEDYKLFPPDVTAEPADPGAGMTINAMPLNSAICEPAPHASLPAGRTVLRGYATASARAVTRVEVSANGGRTWIRAVLEDKPDQPWSWHFWHATLDLSPGACELAVRAWDDAGQTQPALPDETWNHRGYLSAAWHRVAVVAS